MKPFVLRIVTCMLVPAMMGADPALAHHAPQKLRHELTRDFLFQGQALTPIMTSSRYTGKSLAHRAGPRIQRLAAALLLTITLAGVLPGGAGAQKINVDAEGQRQALINQAIVIHETTAREAWSQTTVPLSAINDANRHAELLIHLSKPLYEKFLAGRQAWAEWLTVWTEDIIKHFNTDNLRTPGLSAMRTAPHVRVGVSDISTFMSIESSNPQSKVLQDPSAKKGFWGWLTSLFRGIVISNSATVEEDLKRVTRIHQAVSNLWESQAGMEEGLLGPLQDMRTLWHEIRRVDARLSELPLEQWIQERRLLYDQIAAAAEGRVVEDVVSQTQRKALAFQAERESLLAQRRELSNHLVAIVAENPSELSFPVSPGPIPWNASRETLAASESASVSAGIDSLPPMPGAVEFAEALDAHLSTLGIPADQRQALRNSYPDYLEAAPDLLWRSLLPITLKNRDHASPPESTLPVPSAAASSLFAEIPNSTLLLTTPEENKLAIKVGAQREFIQDLQDIADNHQAQIRFTIRPTLGTNLLLGFLSGFDYRKAVDRSETLATIAQLRLEIDRMAAQMDMAHQKTQQEFGVARGEYEKAGAQARTTRDLIAQAARNYIQAVHRRKQNPRLAIDPLDPFVRIQELLRQYRRDLGEVQRTRELTEFYSATTWTPIVKIIRDKGDTALVYLDTQVKTAEVTLIPTAATQTLDKKALEKQKKEAEKQRKKDEAALKKKRSSLTERLLPIAKRLAVPLLAITAITSLPAVGQAMTRRVAANGASEFALDSGETLSHKAVALLSEQHPEHVGKFSWTDISAMVDKMRQADPRIPADATSVPFHTYYAEPHLANTPLIHSPAPVPAHVFSPVSAPIEHTASVPADYLHHALHWTMANGWNLLIAAAIILIVAFLAVWLYRWLTAHETSNPYKPFQAARPLFSLRSLRLIVFPAAPQLMALGTGVFTSFLGWPQHLTVSLMVVSTLLPLFWKSLKNRKVAQFFYMAVSGALVYFSSPELLTIRLALAAATMILIALSVRTGTFSRWSLLYKLSVHPKSTITLLLPFVLTLFLWGWAKAKPLVDRVIDQANKIRHADSMAVNEGVSLKPERIAQMAPRIEGGRVISVEKDKSTVHKGEWLIVYDPMDPFTVERLQPFHAYVDPALIEKAAETPPASLIRLQSDFGPSSVDFRINETLGQLEKTAEKYKTASETSRNNAEALGEDSSSMESFDEEALLAEMRFLGRQLNALMLERNERSMPAAHDFHIYTPAGMISVGDRIGTGGSGAPLFTRDIPDRAHLQLRLPKPDALALESLLHETNSEAEIHLHSRTGDLIRIPLRDILKFSSTTQPFLGKPAPDLYGTLQTNPGMGTAGVYQFELSVRWMGADKPPLGNQAPQLTFLGLYKGTERVLDHNTQETLGTLRIVPPPVSNRPHSVGVASLQAQKEAAAQLIEDYKTLIPKLESHLQRNPRSTSIPPTIAAHNARIAELKSSTQRLETTLGALQAGGVEPDGIRRFPADPLLTQDLPFGYVFPLGTPEEEGVLQFEKDVVVELSLEITSQHISPDGAIPITSPATGEPVEFKVLSFAGRDKTIPLKSIVAQRQMSLKEARRLFPSHLDPTSEGLIRIRYAALLLLGAIVLLNWHSAPSTLGSLGAAFFAFKLPRNFSKPPAEEIPETEESPAYQTASPIVFPLEVPQLSEMIHDFVAEPPPASFPLDLDGFELSQLRDTLQHTTLRHERYWLKGMSTQYLTLWQKYVTRIFSSEIKLKNWKVLLMSFDREWLGVIDAFVLNRIYLSKQLEVHSGNKTRIMQFALLGGLAFAAWIFWSSNDVAAILTQALDVANGLFPILETYQDPAVRAVRLLFVVGFVGGALKMLGEILSTSPWILKSSFFRIVALLTGVEDDVRRQTDSEPLEIVKSIYENKTLEKDGTLYKTFVPQLERFSHQFMRSLYKRFETDPADQPSQEARHFASALYTYAGRKHNQTLPIFLKPLVLPSEEELIQTLRAHMDYDALPPQKQYWALECARVAAAKNVMLENPLPSFFAAIRYGMAEMANIDEHTAHHGSVLQTLETLKWRLNTLDPDVHEGLRAQKRFADLFTTVHLIFQRLAKNIMDRRTQVEILNGYLSSVINPYERGTWGKIVRDFSWWLKENPLFPRSVIYMFTLRASKEKPAETAALLERLSPSGIPVDLRLTSNKEYLWGRSGPNGRPTTTFLEFNTAYQESFEMLTELVGRFPDHAFFGHRDIYVTCANSINLRQMARELDILLRLTHGRVYVVDMENNQPRYLEALARNVSKRLTAHARNRYHFTSFKKVENQLLDARNALIFSSIEPTDWTILKTARGIRVNNPVEFLIMNSVVHVLTTEFSEDLHRLFKTAKQPFEQQLRTLESDIVGILETLDPGWNDMDVEVNALGHDYYVKYRAGPRTFREGLPLLRRDYDLTKQKNGLSADQVRVGHLVESYDAILTRLDQVNSLELRLRNNVWLLNSIGVETRQVADGDTEHLPGIDLDYEQIKKEDMLMNVLFSIRARPEAPQPPRLLRFRRKTESAS